MGLYVQTICVETWWHVSCGSIENLRRDHTRPPPGFCCYKGVLTGRGTQPGASLKTERQRGEGVGSPEIRAGAMVKYLRMSRKAQRGGARRVCYVVCYIHAVHTRGRLLITYHR